jgi:23S rRNA G2445 N2-methylase RlmL
MHTYYAKAQRAFIGSLEKELKSLGVKDIKLLKKEKFFYLKFLSGNETAWRILVQSRLIESFKLQIKENMKAGTEKELKVNLKNVPFDNYLPLEKSVEYKMPEVKVYTTASKLYHKKMVENIFRASLNKLAFKQGSHKQLEGIDSKIKMIESSQGKLKELPRVDVILNKDKANILLNLYSKPLHMHGYKQQINWGSLRESYASGLLRETKIFEKFDKEKDKKLLIWDPFCGSGTILIEALLLLLNKPARNLEELQKQPLNQIKTFESDEFSNFVKQIIRKNKKSQFNFNLEEGTKFDLKIIGSDISAKSVDAMIENCKVADLDKLTIKFNKEILNKEINEQIKMCIHPTTFHQQINNVLHTFIGDFEVIYKQYISSQKLNNDNKFIIISNIPYGTANQMQETSQIRSLYRRFGTFLRKYSSSLDDVFILINKRKTHDQLNFRSITELKWEELLSFENNGIEVEFLKLEKEFSALKKKKRDLF